MAKVACLGAKRRLAVHGGVGRVEKNAELFLTDARGDLNRLSHSLYRVLALPDIGAVRVFELYRVLHCAHRIHHRLELEKLH